MCVGRHLTGPLCKSGLKRQSSHKMLSRPVELAISGPDLSVMKYSNALVTACSVTESVSANVTQR
jgi:hypothetical protein